MSKKTEVINKDRLALIHAHQSWAKKQEPKVLAFMRYAHNCLVYISVPDNRPKPPTPLPPQYDLAQAFDHSWQVTQAILVPPFIVKDLTIPGNYTQLMHTMDHGMPLLVSVCKDGHDKRIVELADKVDITVPEGKAHLYQREDGGWDIKEDEEEDVDV